MADIQLTSEDLERVKKVQQRIAQITIDMGRTTLAMHEAENDIKQLKELQENLIKDFDTTIKEENSLSEELGKIYGSGVVDIAEGKMVPQTSTPQTRTLTETVVQ